MKFCFSFYFHFLRHGGTGARVFEVGCFFIFFSFVPSLRAKRGNLFVHSSSPFNYWLSPTSNNNRRTEQRLPTGHIPNHYNNDNHSFV
jgi:hypothetical protein